MYDTISKILYLKANSIGGNQRKNHSTLTGNKAIHICFLYMNKDQKMNISNNPCHVTRCSMLSYKYLTKMKSPITHNGGKQRKNHLTLTGNKAIHICFLSMNKYHKINIVIILAVLQEVQCFGTNISPK